MNTICYCGKKSLKYCAKCVSAKYCSRICQQKHWPEHKEKCTKLPPFRDWDKTMFKTESEYKMFCLISLNPVAIMIFFSTKRGNVYAKISTTEFPVGDQQFDDSHLIFGKKIGKTFACESEPKSYAPVEWRTGKYIN